MIIDLVEIKNQAQLKKEENQKFSLLLKNFRSSEIDELVFKLNANVSSQIDCTQCANCCKTLHPAISNEEANRLAELKNESQSDFKSANLDYNELEDIYYIKKNPCLFLNEKICGVYNQRPSSCAEYPHLNKPNFKYRLRSIFINYQMCPIVFNVVEELKKELS